MANGEREVPPAISVPNASKTSEFFNLSNWNKPLPMNKLEVGQCTIAEPVSAANAISESEK